MELLKVKDVKKVYTTRLLANKVTALNGVSFLVDEGEFVAIMGESGSGKTTLLNILAALDKASDGEIYLKGQNLNDIKDKEIAKFRRDNLGFVFQEFNLLPNFNNKDNILLPLVLSNTPIDLMKAKLARIAKVLNIESLLEKYPYEISGGQKQRIAVARALINDPKILLADEPTGALDSKSSDELLKVFEEVNRLGQTILMVTHSVKAASFASRVLFIKDGIIFHQLYKADNTYEEFFSKISDTLTLLLKGNNHYEG